MRKFPKSMSDNKLIVINKAIDLFDYTLTKTSNRKKFPAKYRIIVERMQNISIDIYKCLFEANRKRLYIPEEKVKRNSLQTDAITYCDELNMFIETMMNHRLISARHCEEWSDKVKDVKYLTIAWRTNENG